METSNPLYVHQTTSENIDVSLEFEELFQDVQNFEDEESPFMEQANILMHRGLYEKESGRKLRKENARLGKKIAKVIKRVLEGRNPSKEEASTCYSCFNPASLNLDPLNDEDYSKLLRKNDLLAKELEVRDGLLRIKNFLFQSDDAMKLLAEFVWRNPTIIHSVWLESSLGLFGYRALCFAHALRNNNHLKVLNINGTDASPECIASIALSVMFSPTLETAIFANSDVHDTGALFWGLALAKGSPNLKHLDLSGGKIGYLGAAGLARGLLKHQSLRILNLSNNRISHSGCERLGEALIRNPLLEELNLTGNDIGQLGAFALAAFLANPKSRLEILDLTNNNINSKGGEALAIALGMNKSLKRLVLAQNNLEDSGSASFGPALEANHTLEEFDLSDNDMGDIGLAGLSLGLKTNQCLKVLWVSNQIVRDAGVEELTKNMKLNHSLNIFHLNMNAIGDQGALALANMLKENNTLEELDLSDNEIGNTGGINLGQVLIKKQNRTLQTLNLSNNPISAEISKKYFTAAETRVVTHSTKRIDVVAQGTVIARGNLREFGVIVMRTRSSGFYSVIFIFVSVFISWFDFISDLIVVKNQIVSAENGGSIVYAALTSFFFFFPFLYILVVFSLPASATDSTLPQNALDNNWQGSESLREHLRHVQKARLFSKDRLLLFLCNFFQLRLAYELYLSWKQGLTTLAYSSIRLAEVVFEALPQSIIQINILISAPSLTKIATKGVYDPEDTSSLVLIVSISISLITLSRTIADLFEKKFVVFWKRTKYYEELHMFIGMVFAIAYHFFHFVARAFFIALGATIYCPAVCVPGLVFGLCVRLFFAVRSETERKRRFVIVTYFVGSASWDIRRLSRISHIIEFVEIISVIVPLWIPIHLVERVVINSPLAFQTGYVTLITVITPPVITGILLGAWFVSSLLYLFFIEKIHAYSDVLHYIDIDSAEALARKPFLEHNQAVRERRREKLAETGGGKAAYGRNFHIPEFIKESSSSLREFFETSPKRLDQVTLIPNVVEPEDDQV